MKVSKVFNRLAAGFFLASLVVSTGCKKDSGASGPSGTPNSSNSLAIGSDIDPDRGHLLHAQPKLPTIKVWLGDQELITEIARRPVEIATGMMFRTNTPEDHAMLFVFPDAEPRSFYMRNCPLPLSGAYISPDGEILEIIQMKPYDETGIQSKSSNIQFVLETASGWFERHNIRPGTIVRTERGSLLETLAQRR